MSTINQMFVGLFGQWVQQFRASLAWLTSGTRCQLKITQVRFQRSNGLTEKAWSFTYSSAALTSANGIDWETVWPGSALGAGFGNILLQDIAYGAGRYVIVCGSPAGGTVIMLTSTAVVIWTRSPVSFSATFNAIAYSPTLNMFLAGSQDRCYQPQLGRGYLDNANINRNSNEILHRWRRYLQHYSQ